MSALLVFYGLLALAAHVAEPPAVSPTHEVAEVEAPVEHTHPEVPTSDEVVAADIPPPADTVPAPWGRLADCESGEWDADGNPIPGTVIPQLHERLVLHVLLVGRRRRFEAGHPSPGGVDELVLARRR